MHAEVYFRFMLLVVQASGLQQHVSLLYMPTPSDDNAGSLSLTIENCNLR
jgi:hypothetical protein